MASSLRALKDHYTKGLEKVQAKTWAEPLGKTLAISGKSVKGMGDFVPGASIIGGALTFGSTLLNPEPSMQDLQRELKEIKITLEKGSQSSGITRALQKEQKEIQEKIANPVGEMARKEKSVLGVSEEANNELKAFLRNSDLAELEEIFSRSGVTLEDVLEMDDHEMKTVGIGAYKIRKALHKAVREHQQPNTDSVDFSQQRESAPTVRSFSSSEPHSVIPKTANKAPNFGTKSACGVPVAKDPWGTPSPSVNFGPETAHWALVAKDLLGTPYPSVNFGPKNAHRASVGKDLWGTPSPSVNFSPETACGTSVAKDLWGTPSPSVNFVPETARGASVAKGTPCPSVNFVVKSEQKQNQTAANHGIGMHQMKIYPGYLPTATHLVNDTTLPSRWIPGYPPSTQAYVNPVTKLPIHTTQPGYPYV